MSSELPPLKRKDIPEPERVGTDRCNNYYGQVRSKSEKAILKLLESSSIPLPPIEIAKRLEINPSTCRVSLMRLRRKGYVASSFRGYYRATKNVVTKEGVGGSSGVLTRCHKLVLVVRSVCVPLGRSVLVENGCFRVVVVGQKNGSATVFVTCKGSYSFDFPALFRLVSLIRARFGVEDERAIQLRSFEFNDDSVGVLLEGAKAVTLRNFKGAFERIYQKERGVLRSEANIQQSLPVEAAYALLKGGITPFNVYQASFQQIQEVRNLVEVVKFGNRTNSQILNLLRAFLERLWKEFEDPFERRKGEG